MRRRAEAPGPRAVVERLTAFARAHTVPLVLLGAYVLLRAWIYAGVNPVTQSDTGTYLKVAGVPPWDPDFYVGGRPFFVPLLYSVTDGFAAKVAMHCVVATISWAVLAVVVARRMSTERMRGIALGVLLAFSLAPQIVSWDAMMLPDSLSMSINVLLLAALVVLVERPTTRRLLVTGAIATAWVFTRDPNAALLVMLTLPLAVIVAIRGDRRRAAAFAAGAVLLLLLNNLSMNAGERWEFAQLNNVGVRVLPYEDRREWFADRGMPVTPELLANSGRFASGRDYAFYKIEPFMDWMRSDWRGTYARYLITHPKYTLRSVWEAREQLLAPQPDFPDTGDQAALPPWVRDTLYPNESGSIVFWAIALLGLAVAVALRVGWDVRWAVPVVLLGVAFPHAVLIHHADTMDQARHAVPGAILLRLGLVWLALVVVDRLLAMRAGRFEPPTSRA